MQKVFLAARNIPKGAPNHLALFFWRDICPPHVEASEFLFPLPRSCHVDHIISEVSRPTRERGWTSPNHTLVYEGCLVAELIGISCAFFVVYRFLAPSRRAAAALFVRR